MPVKKVLLFDDSNNPLKIAGISIELFDNLTGTLLASGLSVNLNPAAGLASKEWGTSLSFSPSCPNAVDIYINDANFEYPGNTLKSLNGSQNDDIDLDLLKIALSPLTTSLPTSATPHQIVAAIGAEKNWSLAEKQAAINLLSNYTALLYERIAETKEMPEELRVIFDRWQLALANLGIFEIDLGFTQQFDFVQ
ncbi:MAG TPA: hypothetical protein VIM87_14435 [Chitinophaga sp.]|uniref:hypothetical protein n=1 Tax=Chitinophaga sp. TaxID=1869181 RepID=UPI002F91C980